MEPVRTCLGCRARTDVSSLLRVVALDGEVIPDTSATLPGRGAWVHPTSTCVEIAVKRRAFGRALRVTEALDVTKILGWILASTVGSSSRIPEEQAD